MKRYSEVNPLVNPVRMGDIIIGGKNGKWEVCQDMHGYYSLEKHDGISTLRTERVFGQVAICAQIDLLANED